MPNLEQVKDFNDLPAVITVWPGLGQALGCSRTTAYSIIKQPGFPCVRISPRKIVIPKNRLIKYLEEKADSGLKN